MKGCMLIIHFDIEFKIIIMLSFLAQGLLSWVLFLTQSAS